MSKDITYNQLSKLMKNGALLVDVREREELEVEGGTIKGGEHWPLSTFGIRKNAMPKNKPTIFYCRSGMRSMQAAEIASNWTDQDVFFLQGGYLTYIAQEQSNC
ncbi:MAG: rhodanese-like domain-containing protein [Oligoflexales bacterium]|nr:rhodanese-like domain-containing protein [Oligoflexales bacterium]